jgi:hypothetical protein
LKSRKIFNVLIIIFCNYINLKYNLKNISLLHINCPHFKSMIKISHEVTVVHTTITTECGTASERCQSLYSLHCSWFKKIHISKLLMFWHYLWL